VLFGAGGLGRRTLAGLRQLGIEPAAFTDNNPVLWGQELDGLTVLSPEDAARRFGKTAAFVVTIWRAGGKHRLEQFLRQLHDLGCLTAFHVGYLYWKYPTVFLPHYALDLPSNVLRQAAAALQALEVWADERSRLEYLAQIKWRLRLDFDCLPSPSAEDEQYFPKGLFDWRADEVFVDVGAFDGDTVKTVVARARSGFERLIALEPDPLNFAKLTAFHGSLPANLQNKMDLYAFGAGEAAAKVWFNASGTPSSAAGAGSTEIQLKALDDLLRDVRPTFIKMDIEGAEPQALLGTRDIIRRSSPILAICVYHQQNHLWSIPLWMSQWSDQYRFFLRPHNEEGWDLVCYAVPLHRLTSNG
jgi:FkbM family methyltransferase